MRSCRGRLVWVLLAIVGVLLVVAVASGAIYLALQRQQAAPTGWQDPIASVAADEVLPDLALYPLAGASELDTIDAALANGDLETAYAALVFSLELSDAQRMGRLILLGERFAAADRAALCYQQIYDTAILSPRLNDPARADALLSSGKGWAALGRKNQALNALDQVYVIAVQSPYLQMAHRRDLLSVLETAYRDLGDEEKADACREEIIALDHQVNPQPPAAPAELPDLPTGDEAVSSPEVGALEEARRQAAYALLQAVSDGREPPAPLVSDLAQALQAEDAAKLALYRQVLAGTTQPGERIDVHWQTINWLLLKYQAATQAFGLSLVPEWEAQAADIQSALSKAYEDLSFEYEDLVTALPEASLIEPGSYLVRRQMNLAGRLGRYPNYPAQQMADKLRDAAIKLIAGGAVEPLYVNVTTETDDGELRFFLSRAEEYGLPAPGP